MASYNSAKITEKLNNAIDEACRRIDEFKRSPQDFTRSRSLTPEKMVRIILGLHGQRLDKEMVLAGTDVSTSAFVQRRDKIKPALFECVLNEFYKGLPMAGGVNGYRVLAIDGKSRGDGTWEVVIAGGRIHTGLDVVEWARRGQALGAGEILLTSMDADGTKAGFDIPMTKAVVDTVSIPVIASGGAGCLQHFADVFEQTGCDAALAASLFHYGELTVPQVKAYLRSRNIPVR